jgi:hypothetical protein
MKTEINIGTRKEYQKKPNKYIIGVIDPQTASDERVLWTKRKILPMTLTNAISMNALLKKV